MPRMDVEHVIAHFGGLKQTAEALGLRSHAAVHHWKRDGIPAPRQAQIEEITAGKFKADRKPWEAGGGEASIPALSPRDTPSDGPGGDNSPGRGEGGNNGKEAPTG